jgi:hypothetical protein
MQTAVVKGHNKECTSVLDTSIWFIISSLLKKGAHSSFRYINRIVTGIMF